MKTQFGCHNHFVLPTSNSLLIQVQQISVDNDASSSSSSSSQQPTLGEIILLTPGVFCTPRSVIKNMTSQACPKAEEVQEEMKKLEEKGLGEFVSFSRKESAFHKVIPDDESQETVTSIVGDKLTQSMSQQPSMIAC